MTDLEDLLSDLENARHTSCSSSSSIASSSEKQLIHQKSNFIESINRIAKSKSINIESDHDDDDLAALDSLLNDLYSARLELTSKNNDKKRNNEHNSMQPTSNSDIFSESLSFSSSSASPNSESQKSTHSSNMNDNKDDNSNKLQASRELESLMASLSMYKPTVEQKNNQESLVRPVVPVPSKNECFSCNEPIHGQVITAMGKLWHPEHFQCAHCSKTIGTSVFYEKDNLPYCEQDYLRLFSPKCYSCRNPILDKMLTALDKSWHLNCFVCKICTKPLNDESFLEINNSAYCKGCYGNELAPKCKRCKSAITDNFISALDAYFHPACFVCVDCGAPFNASSFYEYNGMPYCEVHYHAARGSVCNSCNQPINGRCLTALNKKYHPEHFTCTFCLQQLNKGTFKTDRNEKPYCHTCFIKLFPC